jgi:molybdenum cofactor cytidylyltransferase
VTAVTAGLILAAGAGTRFGGTPKQLADLHGRPLLQWAIDAQIAVDVLDPIIVVLGARAQEIRAAIDFGRAQAVVCADWERGQARSLRRGLAELAGAERIVVTLGDAPLVTSQVIARFAAESDPARPTRAVYNGRPGHPVVLGPAQIAALATLDGDRGARGLLRDARTIETSHLCSGRDVDTPEDLEEVRDEARAVI